MEQNYAVHPGLTIKYLLISYGKNQKWLSSKMNMSMTVISEIINQKRNVTPRIALLFEKATGYPAIKLLYIQAEYDLFKERLEYEEEQRVFAISKLT